MARISPTLEGFRATFRWPSLTLAEIGWRWSVGAAACTLFGLLFLEYLNTLRVNEGELLFLRSRQPVLISRAIAHILRGSLARISFAGLLVAAALTVLWIVAASVGRAATVRALRPYFANRIAADAAAASTTSANLVETRTVERRAGESTSALDLHAMGSKVPGPSAGESKTPSYTGATAERKKYSSFFSLVGLNVLRAAVTLAAIFALIGASILAGFASPDSNPQPGLASLLFLPLAALVGSLWLALNWILSLAAVFAGRHSNGRDDNDNNDVNDDENNNRDALGAISAAVALCRDRFGPVTVVSAWLGLAHIATFMGASTAGFFSLGFAGILPGRLVFVAILFVTLIYFALADWLYVTRLGGYVCIAEMPDALFAPAPQPLPPPTGQQSIRGNPLATTIDRNEVILSDVPGLAVET